LQNVVREPYRLRILNGCNAKALIIYFRWVVSNCLLPFYVIGNEGGFLPSVVGPVSEVLLGPAERYDLVFDFSSLTAGAAHSTMLNAAETSCQETWQVLTCTS
jgi:FtsP/CotA-like multicopper oxidase with cupredoxin domain